MRNNNWPPLIRAQHWLTVLLMVLCIGAVWSHEAFDKADPLRARLMQFHFLLGGTIGLLTLPRLLTRAFVKAPVHPMAAAVALLAKAGHLGLYLLMILLPVCGYIAVSGKGLPIDLLGLVDIPPLPVSKDTAKAFKELHEGLANGLIALVALHVAAAIFHAVALKDKVLHSMMGRADE
ncbi:hypothetical protein B9N43_01460 [Denitratisoma sp. DHT3]|uniref:cytochrome b n=1 Tax=Denitratisoma sp. DHT3 TaxID=1981880 RepID=UPI00119846FE|nr:cytochrome b/b6 domain-containing protein [Denitratisoma sp. DHT3]QDX80036.1 hypothetical protein B9N43_01460 [Denitratisoma sp. DHT3]